MPAHNLHLLLQRLADAEVEFVIIGGFAGVIHGSAVLALSLDICVEESPNNAEKLGVVLRGAKPAAVEKFS